jgi:alanine racemase
MKKKTRPVWAEVDLDDLAHNIREVKRITNPDTIIMAVVKANAYGHGSVTAAKVFLENGAGRLAVATLSEAIELRRQDLDSPVLILGYTPNYQFKDLLEYDLNPTLYTLSQAEALSHLASSLETSAKIHLKLDTGLGRIGFLPREQSIEDIIEISKLPHLEIEGIFTHFAVASRRDKKYTREQFLVYNRVLERLECKGLHIPIKHVSNSATIIDMPEYNLDMVRPGCMLYGLYPSKEVDRSMVELRPAMTLKANMSYVKTVPEKTGISYGLTFKTDRQSRIGTLPLGYSDGYRRAFSNRAEVAIRGKRAPVVGSVCMDQCMIDVTDVEEAEIGDDVTLFGDGKFNTPLVEDLAAWIGTSLEEIVSSVSRRVPRVYIKHGKIVEIIDYLNA